MSGAATIDGPKFAHERSALSGRLSIAALPRLAESGCRSAEIRYTLEGRVDAAGKAGLRIKVDGDVEVSCQRCLQGLPVPMSVDADLELTASRDAAEAAEDGVDRVVASRSMSVAELVEDELLLALPMVPMHAGCAAPAKDDGAGPTPFAALAELRKRGAG
jgi:uncharacterized protein